MNSLNCLQVQSSISSDDFPTPRGYEQAGHSSAFVIEMTFFVCGQFAARRSTNARCVETACMPQVARPTRCRHAAGLALGHRARERSAEARSALRCVARKPRVCARTSEARLDQINVTTTNHNRPGRTVCHNGTNLHQLN